MTKRMLIDATHAEETRVAIVDGERLMEFDYESKLRKQLRSSIYLAKITRVEPSLQAAFVNFGGNRHGFLPFSEIHPDYFRIPIADREALLAAQAAELEEHDDEEDDDIEEDENAASADDEDDDEDEDDDVEEVGGADKPAAEEDEEEKQERLIEEQAAEGTLDKADPTDKFAEDIAEEEAVDMGEDGDNKGRRGRGRGRGRGGRGRNQGHNRGRRANADSRKVEMVGGDGIEGDRPFRFNMRHRYKIQEVVKRGQIMLIQVNKEERGNKGAAVTSYLSLPGRYCVLMPNSPRGGGVSRKIANYQDRKRMREILKELEVPEGMSVILRTAGVSRTKAEIKRDMDYLTRLWNTIREETLKSTAPALIYEEGNLIKRTIRDLYTRDIDDILVAGDEGFKTAKDFMKMLIPSHVKRVSEYKDARIPLFHKYRVENQIAEIGKSTVTLKSGGYLVINPTEALISVDVNSGKSTKERHIEETALKTNLEAAEEVARQLRLRDLGGLVVIDFIDMEDRRNNRRVEQKLKDALSNDRARIQVGRISSFGLLELSRQRLNPSLTEMQFEKCKHCDGVGFAPSLDFAAIAAMRALEEEGIKGRAGELSLSVPSDVALYILNNKRAMMTSIEEHYGFKVHIRFDDTLSKADREIEILEKAAPDQASNDDDNDEDEEQDNNSNNNRSSSSDDKDGKDGKRRRRGRRGGRRNNNEEGAETSAPSDEDSDDDSGNKGPDAESTDEKKGNRRGGRGRRRGGRGRNDKGGNESKGEKSDDSEPAKAQKPEPEKKEIKVKAASPSNDSAPVQKDYETVNEAPSKKKRGWWNKLVE